MKLSLIAALLVACATSLYAGDNKERTFSEITIKDLRAGIEAKTVTLIDVNGSESYAKGHIPGAIDFAASEASLARLLPKDKSALVVAYCGGPKCNAWNKGATTAAELGYTNVKHFTEGISGWKESGGTMETARATPSFAEISIADLRAAVESKKAVIIDVNGSESFANGHVPGAIDFAANNKDLASLLPKDKSALVVCYCGGPQCNAWRKGAEAVTALGYTNVKHFKGGISGWKESGGTMEPAKRDNKG